MINADWYAENFSIKEALGVIFRSAFLNNNWPNKIAEIGIARGNNYSEEKLGGLTDLTKINNLKKISHYYSTK